MAPAAYWALKRDRVTEEEIFAKCGLEDASQVLRDRAARIETEPYLLLDQPWPWALPVLVALRERVDLVLVTQRLPGPTLERALDRFAFRPYFSDVLAGRGGSTTQAKAARIRSSPWYPRPKAVMVGDTEVDMDSAHALDIPAVWTRTGIRSRRSIEGSLPDGMIEDVRELWPWLEARGWS